MHAMGMQGVSPCPDKHFQGAAWQRCQVNGIYQITFTAKKGLDLKVGLEAMHGHR